MSQQFEHICIIDDDSVYINLVRKIIELKKIAKNVLVFKNGKIALDYFLDSIQVNENEVIIPRVILLDLNMPVMDGWEFLDEFAKIKGKIDKKIDLYVVSSSINQQDIDRAKSNEVVLDYLTKPLQMNDFEKITL